MINELKTGVNTCKRCRKVLPDLQDAPFCPYCGAKQTTEKKRRRANGEGSVFKRPNGRYRVQLTEYKNGERITKTKDGFKTRAAAYEYIAQLKTAAADLPPVETFKYYFDAFIGSHPRSVSTLNCYKAGIKAFSPLFDLPLSDIQLEDLQACLDDITAGKRTKQNAKTAAGLVYKYAIPRCPELRQINLAAYLRIYDDTPAANRPAFTLEQLEQIRQQIGITPGANIVYCHCYLGFRPSALIALTRDNYHPDGGYFVGGIKTDAGRDRVVPVPDKIRPYFDPCAAFPFSLDGVTPLSLKSYRRLFYDVLAAAGIDNPITENGAHLYSPHTCRHTFATLIKNAPGSDRDKLELMGHTTAEQLREYQSVNLHDLRAIVDAMP